MRTDFLLLAQYNGLAVIPADVVCRDYFTHLTPMQFVRKASLGEIDIPLIRLEKSQKCAKGVHLADLAAYIDKTREAAQKEAEQLRR